MFTVEMQLLENFPLGTSFRYLVTSRFSNVFQKSYNVRFIRLNKDDREF